MLSERNGGNATVTSSTFVDIPRIIGGIGNDMSGKLIERDDGLLVQRAKIRDIRLVKGLGIFGEHDRPIVNGISKCTACDKAE